jgi:hypothetical protein
VTLVLLAALNKAVLMSDLSVACCIE